MHGSVSLEDFCSRHEGYVGFTRAECAEQDVMMSQGGVGSRFRLACAVRHCDVSSMTLVDGVHKGAEHRSVGGGILQAVVEYIKVYHLVDEGVFHNILREVESRAYRKAEIRIGGFTEMSCLSIAQGAHGASRCAYT